MRRLCVALVFTFIAGCSEGGPSNRTEAGAPSDARAGDAVVVQDSQVLDGGATIDIADPAGVDVGVNSASHDSGDDDLEVRDAPPANQDASAEIALPTLDGLPGVDGATTIDGEDGGRLGPFSVEVGATDVDGEPDGASTAPADAWACNAPVCWADLMKDCQPSGTCRQQVSGETSNRCYANGVKVLATVHGVASMLATVKNGTRTCFDVVFDMTSGRSVGFIRDGNGTTVATISDSPSGRSAIACLGHDAVALNEACDSPPWVADVCQSGDCSP
jgi:hypothetical protein